MGFHNHPDDFKYLLWTWRDYAARWLILALVIAFPLIALHILTQ
ncbi:hypothetical protein [Enterobacter phage EC152]